MIVKLASYFPKESDTFIKTDMTIEQINLAIAYFQTLKNQLPAFNLVNQTLSPEDTAFILEKHYDCVKINTNSHENAVIYLETYYDELTDFEKIMKAGIRRTLLELIKKGLEHRYECSIDITEYEMRFSTERLSHMIEKKEIPEEWNLLTWEDKKIYGTIFDDNNYDCPIK